jgi:hypothetical protein
METYMSHTFFAVYLYGCYFTRINGARGPEAKRETLAEFKLFIVA